MLPTVFLLNAIVCALGMGGPPQSVAASTSRNTNSVSITVRTPDLRRFEVATDEVWIESRPTSAEQAAAGGLTSSATGDRTGRWRSVHIDPGQSLADIVVQGRRASPRSEFALALYEPNSPRDPAHRMLLGNRVALLLAPGTDARDVVGAEPVERVPGVPHGYVIRAADPLAALQRADALADKPGVVAAYPLLRSMNVPR